MATMFRMGDFYGLREEARRFVDFVLSNEEITTDKMVAYLSKRPIDLGSIYSKFMATCLVLWLAPESVREKGLRPSSETERSFDLLWLAYEQWMCRGMTHYMEVAGELNSFYGNLRWMAVQNRNKEGAVEILDKYSARAAHGYLTRVDDLAKENFELFTKQIGQVIKKLNGMKESGGLAQFNGGEGNGENLAEMSARSISNKARRVSSREVSASRQRRRKSPS